MNWTLYCPEDTRHLPEELVRFARRQIVNATLYKGDERRCEDRYAMMLPVRAVHVDEDNQPVSNEFNLITRDISSTGIGLVHTETIKADRMAIQFSVAGVDVNLVIDVVWSGPLGPFYGAGGKYSVKLDEFPVER